MLMIINIKASKTSVFCFTGYCFFVKFVGTVLFEVFFLGTVLVSSIISSHIITESLNRQ